MTADDSKRNWMDDLAPAHQQVWAKLKEAGVEAAWSGEPSPHFKVSRRGEELADYPQQGRPASIVVAAALFEAGHKLEAEQLGLKILPAMPST